MCMCLCLYVHHMHESVQGIRSTGTGIIDAYKAAMWVLETKPWFSVREIIALNG